MIGKCFSFALDGRLLCAECCPYFFCLYFRNEVLSKSQNASSLDSDGSEIPQKMTKFVVTMSDEALVGLKPSVKSRLGPRVVTHNSDSLPNSTEIGDAREILIARKTGLATSVNGEEENAADRSPNEGTLDVKKSNRSGVPRLVSNEVDFAHLCFPD